ncbi:peptidylprolyl isomerase [Roseitranquillus sediminis]|uniref:peptidylprolyl isomerase n=1 Tax=Roseitranquillus sediminis TaxID=2809051 RepID=UPI001D0C724F|nr:peptidylprolyl isomerase [Roseitranquillus sediminis]MBM9594432.1 SurA N-terminal domain-containing protein [Roseitranquillus sediminis]
MAVKGAKGKSGRIVVWAILALLIVGLAGFGATNFGGGVRSVGRVGDVEITTDEYARALQNELRQLQQMTGQSLTMAEAREYGIDRSVLQQLVAQAALTNEAERIGLSVGDEQVRREILTIQAFQGIDGSFDREAYEFVLQQNGLSPGEFESEIRRDTARRLLQAAVSGGVEVPAAYADTLFAHAGETRDITWIGLGPDDLQEEIADPADDELRAFHEANPEAFTRPETRVITFAWLTPDMLLDEIETVDEALRQLYEDQSALYRQPERRLVERLVFGSEEAAREAADAIAAGETTFDALVVERDLEPEDIDLGEVARDDLGDAAEAVFALEQPGIAGPAPSNLGPALYRVNGILPPQETSFEDVREELQAEVAADTARRRIDDMLTEVEDLLAGGATLEELADETPMELGQIELGPETEGGIAAYDAFRQAAAAVEVGDFPEVMELGENGGLFALRLDEVQPPRLRPFEEVRDEVAQAWRTEHVRERLLERGEEVAAELRSGATVNELGLEAGSVEGLRRGGFVEELPEDAVETAFALSDGGAEAVSDGARVAVIKVDAVEPADLTGAEAQSFRQSAEQQISQALANDILSAFVRAAETDAGISLDQSAINAVQSQFP